VSVQQPYTAAEEIAMAQHRTHTVKSARLEARLTAEQKALFERAAGVAGRSVTDFVLTSAAAEARRLILEHDVLQLTASDSAAFADAILNPPPPGPRLREAATRYVDAAAQPH
jgi:uncharacterized protein (DUF1778 family)